MKEKAMNIINNNIELPVLNYEGNQIDTVKLAEWVFGVEAHEDAVQLAVKVDLANRRQATAKTKTRSEVSGGGKKPWRQKGTGRARAGSLRSPLFAGGGVIFGPKPRDYGFAMPQKARRLALKSALSARIDNTVLVKDFSEINEPKTKLMAETLKALKVEGKILIIADVKAAENAYLELSARNLPNVRIILPSNLNVKDLLEADNVIITEAAINEITERLSK